MVNDVYTMNKDFRFKREDRVYIKLEQLTKEAAFEKIGQDHNIGFDAELIGREIGICRNNVSKELNKLLKKGQVIKILGRPVLYLDKKYLIKKFNFDPNACVVKDYETFMDIIRSEYERNPPYNSNNAKHPKNALDNIIGAEGSLRKQIEQAKAAVLYPPKGLHTLIVGSTGVGKSTLAEAMYRYAVQIGKLKTESPFVVFNCADYADNPQLLLSQLFGHLKGAFTGADKEKKGLIDKANGGILFLDEVHRLSPEGQEMMFLLMDKGVYRRLGEYENNHVAQVLIIAATTKDPQKSMLHTFLRRIPIIIKLPCLKQSNPRERMSIIFKFFEEESQRIKVPIKVSKDVIEGFMSYDCPGNIGQLRGDTQLVCARAFLDFVTNNKACVEVNLIHTPDEIRNGFLKAGNGRGRVFSGANLNNSDVIVFNGFDTESIDKFNNVLFIDEYRTGEDFYDLIINRWKNFSEDGYSEQEIRKKMCSQIEDYFEELFPQIKHNDIAIDRADMYKIVDEEVFNIVRDILANMGSINDFLFDEKLIYGLALHLEVLIERLRIGMNIYYPYKDKIASEYPIEFEAAKELKTNIENSFKIKIPDDEIGFLTMFLHAVKVGKSKKYIGVLVITHGQYAASSMVEVANSLLGTKHAVAINMPLNENVEIILDKAVEEVKRIDMGKGVILLVDMGSLMSFSEIITEKTGINTMTLPMVSTPMVIEAVRRAMLPDMTIAMLIDDIKNMSPLICKRTRGCELLLENDDNLIIVNKILEDILSKTLVFLDVHKSCGLLQNVLLNIFQHFEKTPDSETTIRFMFHCTCMIERIIKNVPLPYKNLEGVKSLRFDIFKIIKKHFELIEEAFGITVPETEIAYIVDMLTLYI